VSFTKVLQFIKYIILDLPCLLIFPILPPLIPGIVLFIYLSIFIYLFIILLFICAYIVWVISPLFPSSPLSSPFPPQFQAGPVLPLSLVLLKKRDKPNKEDKAFLLVELRIAIQKYS
jgi:hypothetical protein